MFTDPNSPFYAAIAIGSTKVTGMVGRVDSEGAVNVLSYMAISSTDFIRKGRVYNVDKMTQCLKSIRERMENQLNCNIKQVYVALNCQGMRSTTHLEERTFPQRITVQQELIESLKADNRDKISQDQILIDSLPLEYTMGTFSTNEAVGVMTDRIRAQFLNIICNAGAIETIESSFRKAGLPIARHTMAADRLANVMTDEKRAQHRLCLCGHGQRNHHRCSLSRQIAPPLCRSSARRTEHYARHCGHFQLRRERS